MLGMVQVIGLGGGKQDAVHALAAQKPGKKRGSSGPERPQETGERLAQIIERTRPGMDRPQHIHQHHLPVDAGEMGAEKRFHHLRLVGVEAAGEFARQRAARGWPRRQRRKGQGGRSFEVAGQEEPARRTVGKPGLARGLQIGGPIAREARGDRFVKPRGRVGGGQPRAKCLCLCPPLGAGQRLCRPGGEILVQQGQIQQPFAGVIDDIEMHDARSRQARQQAARPHPQRQAQFRHRPGAVWPVRAGAGQAVQMRLEVEPRHRVIGLGLQKGRLDPARPRRVQPGHPAPVQQVRHQRGDEHGLARAAWARDPQPDHRLEEQARDALRDALDLVAKAVGDACDDQTRRPSCSVTRQ